MDRIVVKALCKDREGRYQTVKALLNDLKDLRRELTIVGRALPKHTHSWPKPVPFAVRVLAALAALVIAAVAAWLYFHRPPVLTSRDTILLADFENKTGDAIFDGTLKLGLAIQLQQSPFLNLFPEARAQHTLELMGRPAGERVTPELARAICERENLEASVAGSIAPLGSQYVITLEAVKGQGGDSLAREQVVAEGKEQLQRTSRYETAAEFWPQYLRGQAYLRLGRGAEAAAEFQRILDHRGQAPLSALYPLAHLGQARAAALASDVPRSRQAYRIFFGFWKDADPDLPVRRAAGHEYDRLKP